MPRIIKNNLVTINVDDLKDFHGIVKELTVTNPKYIENKRFSRYSRVSKIPKKLIYFKADRIKNTISVPRSFNYNKYLIDNKNTFIIDKTSEGFKISGKHEVFLRDYQEEMFNSYCDLHNSGITDIMYILKTGGGKTILSLVTAAFVKRNVLVVALTNQLINQWIKVITKPHPELGYRLFPEWTAGKYDLNKPDKLYDVTFVTYSQLAGSEKSGGRNAYPVVFYDKFGHIIFDEYHRAAASSFSTINNRATCRYKTTLTATFRRVDGMTKMLKHYISEVIESLKKSEPAVIIMKNIISGKDDDVFNRYSERAVGIKFVNVGEKIKAVNGNITYYGILAKKELKKGIIKIITKGRYIDIKSFKTYPMVNITIATIDNFVSRSFSLYYNIVSDVIKYLNQDRKIIVISKSLKVLFLSYYFLDKAGVKGLGLIMSDKRKEYKEFVKKLGYSLDEYSDYCMKDAKVILGIDRIAKEGMDVDRADTLIIVNPIKDPEQIIGRIDRDYGGKKKKLVVAYTYDLPIYRNIIYGNKGFLYWIELLGHQLLDVKNLSAFEE